MAVLLGLAAVNTTAQAEDQAALTVWKASEHTPFPFSISGHSEWKPVTIDLLSTMQAGSVRVEGKKSFWDLKISLPAGSEKLFPSDSYKMPVVGFIAPSGGIWVGPEKKFYIESLASVVGAEHHEFGIAWFESLVVGKGHAKTTLDDCLKLFEREIDATALDLCSGGIAVTAEGSPVTPAGKLVKCARIHFTSWCPPLDRETLGSCPGTTLGDVELIGVQVTGNTLRLNLKSKHPHFLRVKSPPSKSGTESYTWTKTHYEASVWIDIPSKKLIKAEQNGRSRYLGEDLENVKELFRTKRIEVRPADGNQQPVK